MPRPPMVPPRTAVFVFVEGESDIAFARFLGGCVDTDDRLHLDIKSGSGGDPLAVVKAAINRLKKHGSGKDYYQKIVLLDKDRMKKDKQSGRDPHPEARKHGLEIIFQDPNLEGLLLRMHPGNESKKYQPKDVKKELKKFWPEYDKSKLNEYLLDKHFKIVYERFTIEDFRQAAKYDQQLQPPAGVGLPESLRQAAKYDQQLQRLITILKSAMARAENP